MLITKPAPTEYDPYYHTYIGKVVQNDLIAALKQGAVHFENLTSGIPNDKADYRYAEGKWSVKEVLGHMLDAERVFSYRALRFARNDKTVLAGFDENTYAPESNAVNRNVESLLNEGIHIRQATISLFESFTEEMTKRTGRASGKEISVRALGFIIAGHELHHLGVLKERYLL